MQCEGQKLETDGKKETDRSAVPFGWGRYGIMVDESNHAFPLSHSQKNIWDLENAYEGTSINHITNMVRIKGLADLELLQKSIQMLLKADIFARIRIHVEEGVPVQTDTFYQEQTLPIYDFSLSGEEGLDGWANAMAKEALPVQNSPLYRFWLFRLGENEGGVLIKMHHLISDGWTQVMLCNRIQQIYLALLEGKEPDLGQIPSYRVHVEEEQKYLQSSICRQDTEYWKSVLAKEGEPATLSGGKSAGTSPVGRRRSHLIPENISRQIHYFCKERRLAPLAVFYLALAIYIRRTTGAQNPVMGVPVLGRVNFTAKKTSGMFVSTLPFLCPMDEEQSFSSLSETFLECWLDLLRHQKLPFSKIGALAQEMGQPDRLFQVALSYQDSRIFTQESDLASFSGYWYYSGYQAEQLCIHLSDMAGTGRFSVEYDYQIQFFSPEQIDTLHGCICHLLSLALAQPEEPVRRFGVLPPYEANRVLQVFNRTEKALPQEDLSEILVRWAQSFPDRIALLYRGQGMDYYTLLAHSRRVSAALEDAGVCDYIGEERLVAVLLPRTPQLYCAIAGAMCAGTAYLLLSSELPEGRIREILAQSGAKALLSTKALTEQAGLSQGGIPWIDMEHLPQRSAAPKTASPADLAYVVYTSGSTGAPKGVQISRRNLLNLAQAMESVYGAQVLLSVCNVGFDAFVLESAAALLNGKTVVLPGEEALQSPKKLAELIFGYEVGFLSLTPSRLSAYLQDGDFLRACKGLTSIVCGGEAFPPALLSTLRRISQAKIYNQYGPSETTVGVSIQCLNHGGQITAGKPMENCRLYILDPFGHPLPVGVYGELYVGGVCVGRGYRGAPKLTEESFLPSPFVEGERIYRTGDLACWSAQGELILGGRTDHQVKLRGLRIELQEVSARIAAYPGVLAAAARVFEQDGQGVLAAYYTSEEPLPEGKILGFVGEYLPGYMIPSSLQRLEDMPYTSSGKVDEKRLPAPQARQSDAPARTKQEQMVLSVFRRVLKKPELGVESDYFQHGGNSLNAMEALGEIGAKTGRELRILDLHVCRTARKLAQLLGEGTALLKPASVLERAPEREKYPLSQTQQSIYVHSSRPQSGYAYHMPGALQLAAQPDILKLQNAFAKLIAQDRIFRSSYHLEPEGLFCRVAPQVDFTLPVIQGENLEEAAARFLRPFDLSQAPLLRGALWQDQKGNWYLLVDSHHIIGDGMSTPLVMERLDALYKGEEPTNPPVDYLDFAYSQGEEEKTCSDENAAYWRKALTPLPEPLELPTDFARPLAFDFKGAQLGFSLTADFSDRCDRYCEESRITPFMLFVGAYSILLSRMSGKKSLTIGTPVAGRTHSFLQKVCGPFLTTLPLKLSADGEKTAEGFLEEVSRQTLEMLDHQDMSMEALMKLLDLPRSLSRNPLYEALFSFRPLDASGFSLGGSPVRYHPIPTQSAKLDLSLEGAREKDRYFFTFEYAAHLFTEKTMALYARSFETVLRGMVENKSRRIADLPILAPADYFTLIEEPVYQATPYRNLPVHQMIQSRAQQAPEKIAYYCGDKAVRYETLLEGTRKIAGLLIQQGAQKGDRIGLCCRRDEGLFEAILGILMAGCAYVPFLDSYPVKRIDSMMDAAQVKLVLCGEDFRKKGLDLSAKTVELTTPAVELPAGIPVGGNDLMYVLFTSGSTGQPKGVMLTHQPLSNLLGAMRPLMQKLDGPILCATNVVFDTFITESLLPLALGIPVVLADEEEMLLPWKLAEKIERHQVRMMQFTPSRLKLCLGNDAFCAAALKLDRIILVGEAVSESLFRAFRKVSRARVLNMYGPTEAAVYVTVADLQEKEPVHIGTPLQNCRVYLLDEHLKRVPPTAWGEMFLAGDCLAKGYIGREDLTAQMFLPDPFFPGEKMYRSGDLARLRADGNLEFLGRRDGQIKINGQRVELEEITDKMRADPGVAQAAVIPLKKPDGSTELMGFVTLREGEALSQEKMRKGLEEFLPAYMIPGSFRILKEMPYTPSGKLDLPKLKEWAQTDPMAETPPKEEEIAPAPPKQGEKTQEEELAQIWREVLGKEQLATDQSFFQQGGSSLAALNVLSGYFNRGWSLTLAQFYEHPTLKGQAALIWSATASQREERAVPLKEEPAQTSNPVPRRIPRFEEKITLLTGATGFLGAHLLEALLRREDKPVLCLIRGEDPTRLLEILEGYFGQAWREENRQRILTVQGDLAKPLLGLAAETYADLAGRVDRIYHSGADVRHYVADEEALMQVNLGGTVQMIALARKADAALHFVSTASVSGEYLLCAPDRLARFTEEDGDIGQNWQDNVYIKSKLLAEKEIWRAKEQGLQAKIYRVGRLVGRASDGMFQKNPQQNAFYRLLQSVKAIQTLPKSLAQAALDLTPVDFCAEEILALEKSERDVFHLLGPVYPLRQAALAVCPALQELEDDLFHTRLTQALQTQKVSILADLVDLWNRVRSMPQPHVQVSDQQTKEELEKAGFVPPEMDLRILLGRF